MSKVEKLLGESSVAKGLLSTSKIVPGKYSQLSRYIDTGESIQAEFRSEVQNVILSKKISTELSNAIINNNIGVLVCVIKFLYVEITTLYTFQTDIAFPIYPYKETTTG